MLKGERMTGWEWGGEQAVENYRGNWTTTPGGRLSDGPPGPPRPPNQRLTPPTVLTQFAKASVASLLSVLIHGMKKKRRGKKKIKSFPLRLQGQL